MDAGWFNEGTISSEIDDEWKAECMANKDKGGKSTKKPASKSLKEKRQAKKEKRQG